jgi:citronellol/citronellal dehydrogenase
MAAPPNAGPPRLGLGVEELWVHPTVYREGLMAGRAAIVSGGGSGLGRATALLLARLGAKVAICGRNGEALNAVATFAANQGRPILTVPTNIRNPAQVAALFDRVAAEIGPVDVLVNSAGGQFPQPAIDYSLKGWNAVIDTNLNGTWYMMQTAAQRWRDADRPGVIVNVVTVIDRGMPGVAHTCAARAGVIYLSKSLAVEWAPLGIRINCVAPGAIETEGMAVYPPEAFASFPRSNPMKRFGDAWDVAEACVYLAAPTGKFVTGEVLTVDGGGRLWGEFFAAGKPDYFA